MKKFFGYLMLATMALTTVSSCRSSRNTGILGGATGAGTTITKTVATIVGVILLSKIVNAVLKTVSGSTAFNGIAQNNNFAAGFNEDTMLTSFANNDLLKMALQVLVAERFQIPLKTVATNYSNLNTVGDLSTFIGKNASATVLNEFK